MRTGADKSSKFNLGQVVHHQRYHFRGVIYDVDPQFMLPDEWYEQLAGGDGSKNQPWYRLLIDGVGQEAYVPEQCLSADDETEPVDHPAIGQIFGDFREGRYQPRHVIN